MTVTAERETCRLHPDGCRDGDRHPLSVKIRTDIRRAITAMVRAGSAETVNSFGEEALEARAGVVRCAVCHEAVPLVPADITGKPLDSWIRSAVEEVRRQHHGGHAPVPLGAVRTPARPVRKAVPVPRPAPSAPLVAPGSVKFQEPGGSPVTTEVPARKRTQR